MELLESITIDDIKVLDLPETALFPYCGYGNNTPKEEILVMMRSLLTDAMSVGHPQFGYRIVKGEALDKVSFRFENELFTPGPIITKSLKGCAKYIFLVVTVGEVFDNWLQSIHKEGDLLKTYLSDAIGSATAEATERYACAYLEKEAAKEGLKLTNAYSPGYCDWPLINQQKFFALFPENFCGITLNDSCLMHPIKSISCVIGLDVNAVKLPYGCSICRKNDCFLKIARAKNNVF